MIISSEISRVRSKLSAEKAAKSGTLNTISMGVMYLAQGGVALAINEITKSSSTEELKLIALGTLGLSAVINAAVEARTLKKKGYSGAVISTGIYNATGNIPLALTGSFLLSNVNPIDIVSGGASWLNNDGGRMFFSSVVARNALGIVPVALNLALSQNCFDPLTSAVSKLRGKFAPVKDSGR